MIDIDGMFQYKRPDRAALLADGFAYAGGTYTKDVPIMKKQFVVQISVTDAGAVGFSVREAETGEEYVLVHAPGATGGFIGDVRTACEKVLADVSDTCFRTELLHAEQTRRTVAFLQDRYGAQPEFLWEKYPNYAAFRRPENGKWFAVIMTVDKSKLALPGRGNMEILDLKDTPENVERRVDKALFFPAYHMNKKHWYTVCLDGRIPDEELNALIHTSYRLTAGREKKKH